PPSQHIVWRLNVTAIHGKALVGNQLCILLYNFFILSVRITCVTDRGSAKSDQQVRVGSRVTHKVSVQCTIVHCKRETVMWKGKMIHPDLYIPSIFKQPPTSFIQCPFGHVRGKISILVTALSGSQPRDVRITVKGNSIRP